jgi:hypothetical protein
MAMSSRLSRRASRNKSWRSASTSATAVFRIPFKRRSSMAVTVTIYRNRVCKSRRGSRLRPFDFPRQRVKGVTHIFACFWSMLAEFFSTKFDRGGLDGVEGVREYRVNREIPANAKRRQKNLGGRLKDGRAFYFFATHLFACSWSTLCCPWCPLEPYRTHSRLAPIQP